MSFIFNQEKKRVLLTFIFQTLVAGFRQTILIFLLFEIRYIDTIP